MAYDGLGNRLEMTAYAEGQSVTTRYVLDNGQVLAAIAGGSSTFYLYGNGPLAERTDAWAYPLADGSRTARQLVDASGNVVQNSSYTPWGDTLSVSGSGSFMTGYLGGIMDSATGLLYVGNGQYYDPATGRFLNRNARPNQANPYVPWSGDPLGALMAPLAVMTVVLGRKKKHGKWEVIAVVAVLCITAGMSLSACTDTTQTPTPTQTQPPTPTQTTPDPQQGAATQTGTAPAATSSPTVSPTYGCTPTPTVTNVPTENVSLLGPMGKKVYETFLVLRDEAEGWWNDNSFGTMTPLRFLNDILRFEFRSPLNAEVYGIYLSETVVRNFHTRCTDPRNQQIGFTCEWGSTQSMMAYIAVKKLISGARREVMITKDKYPTKEARIKAAQTLWADDNSTNKYDFNRDF